jgi:endonuclease YncB( thermonuclease family)
MIRKGVAAGAVALLLAVSTPAAAERVCKVVGIADGDTMTVLCAEREQVKIRIAEIDAPEKKQPFGTRSKQSLSDLCFGKQAEVFPEKTDRYGRMIARVKCDGTDASAHQVQTGMAWVYDRYVTDRSLYPLQDLARSGRRGLWVEAGVMPPWKWRKKGRATTSWRTNNDVD